MEAKNNKFYKSITEQVSTINYEEKSCECIISTSDVDLEGDVIYPDKIDDKSIYDKNPVVLFMHDMHKPIAHSAYRRIEGNKLISKTIFNKSTILSKECFDLVAEGTLRGWSIGFINTGTPIFKDGIYYYDTVSMYEYSLVSVPAQSNAITLDFCKRFKSFELQETFSKNYILNEFQNEIQKTKSELELLKNDVSAKVQIITDFEKNYSGSFKDIIFEINNQKSKKQIEDDAKRIELEIKKAFQNYK